MSNRLPLTTLSKSQINSIIHSPSKCNNNSNNTTNISPTNNPITTSRSICSSTNTAITASVTSTVIDNDNAERTSSTKRNQFSGLDTSPSKSVLHKGNAKKKLSLNSTTNIHKNSINSTASDSPYSNSYHRTTGNTIILPALKKRLLRTELDKSNNVLDSFTGTKPASRSNKNTIYKKLGQKNTTSTFRAKLICEKLKVRLKIALFKHQNNIKSIKPLLLENDLYKNSKRNPNNITPQKKLIGNTEKSDNSSIVLIPSTSAHTTTTTNNNNNKATPVSVKAAKSLLSLYESAYH
ncbi:Nrm1p SCDLUD_001196 [Saccharomycodes ludwigii]|uniref:Nrm1p n=1 Tax=Saccharomycodes ludwigii TaxID=36035 RepID=UPI001E8717AF|nr:hypothetical protein SCDLUD_001196 [Saccharomycodes ludwigii]KAH3903554.1 hypothetical protein SCDLUD_001196 [Saccharomycodes ludwigii]